MGGVELRLGEELGAATMPQSAPSGCGCAGARMLQCCGDTAVMLSAAVVLRAALALRAAMMLRAELMLRWCFMLR